MGNVFVVLVLKEPDIFDRFTIQNLSLGFLLLPLFHRAIGLALTTTGWNRRFLDRGGIGGA